MRMKVARVVRSDVSGDFIQHDRERFAIHWDQSAKAFPFRRGERYVWVEAKNLDPLSTTRLLLFDERERFLGHADVAKVAKEMVKSEGTRHRQDPDEVGELVD